jgi:tRNA pseudouridine38-40 synthase
VKKFVPALNGLLSDDIVIIDSEEVDCNFHSRYDAVKKWYRYTIYNNKVPDVFVRKYSMFTNLKLDVHRMKKAAEYFQGRHSFKSFCSAGSAVNDYIRTIYSSKITKENNLIIYDIIGSGFLYNMVRIIVGTLIEVGKGKICPEEIIEIINAELREAAGPTAKPEGLCLYKVYYN